VQALHAVPDRDHHPPHLPVATLVEHELEAPGAEPPDARRRRPPVLELHPIGERAERGVVGLAVRLHLVDLLDAVARVREAVRERPVVREQERAGRVCVEPPDRHDPNLVADEVEHRPAPLRVARRRHDAGRLVQEDIREPLLGDSLPVHLDDVASRDERVQLARRAVHAHASRLDQVVRLAARCHTGAGQVRVQPHRRILAG
jgi:hypothetical protein